MYHCPVMLKESIEGLAIKADGIYVDVTFGSGSHSRTILSLLGEKGRLIAFDQDEDAIQNKIDDPRFIFIEQNFVHLKKFCRFYGYLKVDGILADLGVSSHQFDTAKKGFSTRFDGDLDMRMSQKMLTTASDIVNNYDVSELARLFTEYGEINHARKIAEVITAQRAEKAITTTAELTALVKCYAPHGKENKFVAQVFQALRIEVNKELEVLQEMLQQAIELLDTGGRLVVMSYHSLEDRLVKNFMRSGNVEGAISQDFYGNILTPFRLITRKAVVASAEEIANNNRARSAKLRIAEKK